MWSLNMMIVAKYNPFHHRNKNIWRFSNQCFKRQMTCESLASHTAGLVWSPGSLLAGGCEKNVEGRDEEILAVH